MAAQDRVVGAAAPGPPGEKSAAGDVARADRGGLTASEASARLQRDGLNVIPSARGPGLVQQFGRELVHFFALMLWLASGLALIAGLLELAAAIAAVVIANAVFSFVQEHRAERAAQHLRGLMPRRATVIRDGTERAVAATNLVVGDLVVLRAGDGVCADIVIDEAHGCTVDESMLTGESQPVSHEPGSMVRSGTFVVEGEARGHVTATGAATRLAALAALTRGGVRPRSPLDRQLRRLVRTIATIAVGVGLAFFAVGLLTGIPVDEGFVFAIGVTVALVPEGLLPTVTLTLALGAQRMAGRSALVRRLEAVETLGSTTFICTDKTGTLTANRMAVVEAWTPAGQVRIDGSGYDPQARVSGSTAARQVLESAAAAGARCGSGHAVERDGRWVAEGDPLDAAVDVLARRLGVDTGHTGEPILRRFPFDPRRRRMSVTTTREVLVKGAPDGVVERCHDVPDGVDVALASMTERGLRVIAVARRRVTNPVPDVEAAEQGLQLLALLGLQDPPRPHAADAIAACRQAGVHVAMVTGDHPATAMAIARAVGLAAGDDAPVLGADLPEDDKVLGTLVDRDGVVIARVAPEDKLRIARALQARGHVVAMTGDGVNDGPALQQADVGVAMGASGTDVAREAADLVLLDDDFATIVVALEQGRTVFANVRRFLTYHLTDNVAQLSPFLVWALSGGRFPLALTVLQVLALDLGTDTFSAVALGAEPPRTGQKGRGPSDGRLLDSLVARRAFGILGPVEAVLAMTAFVVTLVVGGWQLGAPVPDGELLLQASGATFATVVLAQTANAFACRSTRLRPGAMGWGSNRLLVVAAVVELGATSLFLFVPPVAEALRHAPPALAGWMVAAAAPVLLLVADAVDKALRLRRRGSAPG